MMNADHADPARHPSSPTAPFIRAMPKSFRLTSAKTDIGAHSKTDMALVGDIKATLRALLPLVEEKAIVNSSIKLWSTIGTPVMRDLMRKLSQTQRQNASITISVARNKLAISPLTTLFLPAMSARRPVWSGPLSERSAAAGFV